MTEEDKKTEQTAVAEDTKAASTESDVKDSGAAQDDGLDDLLKEFDERRPSTTKEDATTKSEPTTDTSKPLDVAALETLEKELRDVQAREARRELEKVFSNLSEGVEADAIDAESFLNAQAIRDPRLNQAYANRQSNPKAWDKVLGVLRQDFAKRYGKKVDKQVTASKDAVASAVRSASTAAPQTDVTDKDIQRMSKDEFDALQRKMGVTPV